MQPDARCNKSSAETSEAVVKPANKAPTITITTVGKSSDMPSIGLGYPSPFHRSSQFSFVAADAKDAAEHVQMPSSAIFPA
jgi:hypothetical protein